MPELAWMRLRDIFMTSSSFYVMLFSSAEDDPEEESARFREFKLLVGLPLPKILTFLLAEEKLLLLLLFYAFTETELLCENESR